MIVTVNLDGNSSLENISLGDYHPPSAGDDVSLSQQTSERVDCFIHGGCGSDVMEQPEVFEAVSIFDPNAEIPRAHEVCVTYVNGSFQTLLEAQHESLYLSEVRGEPVRLLYNSGWGGGGGRSRLLRRPVVSCSSPLCQALIESLKYFFSHPDNQHRHHTIIFYGDGGAIVNEVLRHVPYGDRVRVIGIAPTTYVTGSNAAHFRVSGDMTTLLDSAGFARSNVTTLAYSSGAEGLFLPSLRCPSYVWALRLAHHSSSGESSSESMLPLASNQISLVEIGHGQGAFERLSELLQLGETSSEVEFNFTPQSRSDILLSSIFCIFRVCGLLQEYIIVSVTYAPDVYVSYVIIFGYTLNLLRYFLLLLTNRRSVRDAYRSLRLIAHGLTPLIFLVTIVDNLNCVRRYGNPFPILQAIFVVASTLSGSVIFMELLRNCFRGLRGRIQTTILQRLTGAPQESQVVVRSVDGNRIGAVQAIMGVAHGIFLSTVVGILNSIVMQVPSTLGRSNTTDANDTGLYSNHLHNASLAWQTGDVLAVSQTISLFMCLIVFIANIIVLVGLVSNNRRR
ncbi:DUF687 domain-containing protein [Chlamydia psittaci]|uniref:DUF687 domain-containing protein n=1 Tax=Chlamydia psittaci TaxID=83554 RepID=UPI00027E58F0|nr:DUF687 domain-containing protein [Chlamydia psittaci]AFS28263.1 hypothetical protein B712_0757 [Chlamydia psittaci NJ1]KPZ36104.1 membrane protein [Chlamydia psittaci NJ1]MDS0919290.1 DUF687 domain-containing protein [Chlamydia psittaci]MDS0989321.1 DUF687 domain-containing protein [Chlamydia psittaci]MDS0995296.1 DUF687 domain-containing protein [Chlamydia psittaci]